MLKHPLVRSAILRTLLFGAAVAPTLISAPAQAEIIDGIAAIVGDDVVTMSDVMSIAPVYLQVLGANPASLTTPEGRSALGREILDHVINTKLVVAEAEAFGMTISDRELEAYLADRRQQMRATEEQFEAALAAEGIALEDFESFMRDNLTLMRMVQVDVVSQVHISNDQIDRAIAEQYPDGLVDTYITTSHLLVEVGPDGEEAAEQHIQSMAAALRVGTPFETLAEQNADATASRGGRVGRFRIDMLDEAYTRAALALEVGEVSEPIRSSFGWHIVRLEELEQVPVEDEARIREEVEIGLQQAAIEDGQARYFERLREEAFVEIINDEMPW